MKWYRCFFAPLQLVPTREMTSFNAFASRRKRLGRQWFQAALHLDRHELCVPWGFPASPQLKYQNFITPNQLVPGGFAEGKAPKQLKW
jgi:hypothetical protein